MRACTFERTSALSLSDMRSAKPTRMGSYRAPRSHTRPHDDDIALFLPVPLASLSARAVCSIACTLTPLFSFPSSTRRSKEAKVEANHHAITAPGAAGTPTRSQKAATAFCRLGAFTTAVPVLQNQQSSSCAAEKRALPLLAPRSPPLFAKSPEGRPIVRLLASGESIARIAAIPPWQCLSREEEGMH